MNNNSSFNGGGGILRNVDDEQIMVNHQMMIPNLLSSNNTANTTTTMTTSTSSIPASSASTATLKKKRNLPGTPYPDAEIIALSPKTLMATNRFICEVCNKGFQREQNLQLHRRGHNLPWKLKQKTKEVVRRKVYLCPEPSCVHHEPSRALGDLTGIKKHFSRKHGEKKWKCDKCSKRYAVQSDWKAHSKTCGTREYRCDCGTLFSRRDSFITHRAFCDALAQESASRHPTSLNMIGNHHLYGSNNNQMSLGHSGQVGIDQMSPLQNPNNPSPSTHLLKLGGTLGTKFEHMLPSSFYRRPPPQQQMPDSPFFMNESNQQHGYQMHSQNLGLSPTNNNGANMFNLGFFSNNNIASSTSDPNSTNISSSAGFLNHQDDQYTNIENGGLSSLYQHHENLAPPQMSATALLQKAAQMGSTTSGGNNNTSALLRGLNRSISSMSSGTKTEMQHYGRDYGNVGGGDANENHIQGLMNSLASGTSSIFGGGGGHENDCVFEGYNGNDILSGSNQDDQLSLIGNETVEKYRQSLGVNMGKSDKLTLDFLGVGGMMRNIGSDRGRGYLQGEQQQQQQQRHQGDHHMLVDSFDNTSMKPTQGNLQFEGAKHQ